MSTAIQVETFEATEQTTETGADFDAEAVELIERLGLGGQKSLLLKRETGDGAVTVRNPYRRMTAEEQRVYAVRCPVRTKLADYQSSAIPLRVLQVAAHAVEFFERVEVWHPNERVDNDPLLVGVVRKKVHTWHEDECFLLARWGAVLLPFDELREQAIARLRRDWTAKAKGAIREAESFIASIERNVERHLSGEFVSVPS